jgi:hypothetical protein
VEYFLHSSKVRVIRKHLPGAVLKAIYLEYDRLGGLEIKAKGIFFSLLLALVATQIMLAGLAGAAILTVPGDHATIQAAINAAADGDTITVSNGSWGYIELGTIAANTKDNLTIQALNPGGATINAPAISDGSAVYIEGDAGDVPTGTVIDGFNLQRAGAIGKGSGVFVFNSNAATYATVTVQNCSMSGGTSFHTGVRMCGYVQATITDNTITGPRYAGIATSAAPANEDTLDGTSTVTIKGNDIDGNSVTEKGGILLKGGSGNTVQAVIGGIGAEQNLIHHNGAAGIRLEDIYGTVTIDNNDIYNNTEAGICVIDVGSGSATATIKNNNIYSNTEAGISVAGAAYLAIGTIGNSNAVYDNGKAGVAFNKGDIVSLFGDSVDVSSKPVTITQNNIYSNDKGGIAIVDAITGAVTITQQNEIYQNTLGGIGIQSSCTVQITKNSIYGNLRGGIHTGTDVADGGGFSGTSGSASLTVRQNKVYGNGQTSYGAGIDVRHASGTIHNNLVYENCGGGIRFGDDITEIINNTVVDNGENDKGGGIVYDDLTGGVNDAPNGDPPGALSIRNNISAFNHRTGMRACFDNTQGERDYNLVYSNRGWDSLPDCGWPNPPAKTGTNCTNQQYGGCGAHIEYDPAARAVFDGPEHDIMDDPLFVDRATDDYTLQAGSPAIDAGDPDAAYNDTDASRNDMGAYGGPTPIDW